MGVTLITSSRIAYMIGRSWEWGIPTSGFTVDMPAIKKRKDEVVTQFRAGSEKGLHATQGLDIIFGEATFSGTKELTVTLLSGEQQALTVQTLCIDTGVKPQYQRLKVCRI
jgi:pyruvate/2-oxoglutarate dehydrogenase complex dihydrolipoamide dehydrogenase (E3) component